MVERNFLESNLAGFLAGSTGVTICSPPELRKDTFPSDMDEGCMSAEEEREQRRGWRENGEPLDDKMISLLVSKVKRSRWRNFADVVASQHSQSKRESVQNCTVKVQSSVTLQSPDAWPDSHQE